VHAVAFSNDGQVLAAGSNWCRPTPRAPICFGELKLWDVASGRERSTLKGEFGYLRGLAISPDKKTLAVLGFTNGNEDQLTVLDVTKGGEVLRHKGKRNSLLAVSFTANGMLFLVDSPDRKTLRLWELPHRKEGQPAP
jgi:WD40 repeat protein